MIYTYKSHTPKIAKTALVHPSAVVIGDVTIGEHSTIGREPYCAATCSRFTSVITQIFRTMLQYT